MRAIGLGFDLVRGGALPRPRPAFDFSSGAMPAGATLSRGSPACHFDAAGRLTMVGADVARFDHDVATGRPLGLLLENAATTLATVARYDATRWTFVGGATLTPGIVGIDGVAAAARCDMRGASSQQIGIELDAPLPPGATVTLSWFARSATMTALGTCGYYDSSTAIASAALAIAPGPWRRVTQTIATGGVSVAAPTIRVHGYDGAAVGEAVVIDWLQIETGAAATSPIPRADGQTTRAADQLTLDWGRFGVGDCGATIRYRFDDASFEDVATEIAGGVAPVPPLARPWLARAALL